MSPKPARVLQPPHLSVDDAWRVLVDAYDEADIQEIRDAEANGQGKLAFQYKHGLGGGGDKDALYKYRNVIKAYAKINNTGVWNWTVILGAVKKWDAKSLGKLLSSSKALGPKAVANAASNLAQLLQDARNYKRNMKTGTRTPGWLMEIIEHIVVKDASDSSEGGACQGTIGESWSLGKHSPGGQLQGKKGAREEGACSLTIGDSSSPGEASSGGQLRRKRTLKLALSTTSEEETAKKKPMLAIEDVPPTVPYEDNIPDTNGQPFEYGWDEVTNRGKRLKPGGRWQPCHWQEKDPESGFMKCFWRTVSGIEDWISEMTILEYESNEPDEVLKKPAAVMKKPAAVMKKPAAVKGKKKLDPGIRKREHSRIYHQTVDQAMARGDTKEIAQEKAREAAGKHIQKLISKL